MQLECNLREQLGERLKQARSGLGLTQKELCFRVGMPLPSIKDYETCKRLPGAEAICAYVRAGINANWLLTGEGPMLLADLVDASAERHKADLFAAFQDFWLSYEHEVRREVAVLDFQDAYNAGKIERIPGVPSISTKDIDAVCRADKPAPPPPQKIDEAALALMLEGVIRARPDASPGLLARMAVDFYVRTQQMEEAKPEAA